eukprot:Em0009g1071a
MDDEEEEEEEDTDDSGEAVLPRERKSFPPKDKINNFVKVHNSYNADRGLDCYDMDFIDDEEVDDGNDDSDSEQKLTPARTEHRRSTIRNSPTGDDLQIPTVAGRKRKASISSQDSNTVKLSRRGNKLTKGARHLDSSSGSSSVDSRSSPVCSPIEKQQPDVRRTPSSRARQLRERKENMTESCLKKLRRQRARVRGAKELLSGSSSCSDSGDDITSAPADPSERLRRVLVSGGSSSSSDDTDHWVISDSDKEPNEPLAFLNSLENVGGKDWRWLMSVCGMFEHTTDRGTKLDREPQNASEMCVCAANTTDPMSLDEHGFPPAVYAAARAQSVVMATLLVDPEWVCHSVAEKGTNLLNVILEAPLKKDKSSDRLEGGGASYDAELDESCLTCLKTLQDHLSQQLLLASAHPTPLDAAVWYNRVKCVGFLVESGASLHAVVPDSGGDDVVCGDKGTENAFPSSLLHLAILSPHTHGKDMLSLLLPTLTCELELCDSQGYTPTMHAAEMGDSEALAFLLDNGASVNTADSSGTSSLHLAALSGSLACVELLINRGHPVDCRDSAGWSPLLYAHFEGYSECVLMLMKAKPGQLSVLSDLLKNIRANDSDGRMRATKVVRSLLLTLAHHEAYYAVFNDFVHSNPSVLGEDGFGFMKHCMGLLSFENRVQWVRSKFARLRAESLAATPLLLTLRDVDRQDVFNTVVKGLGTASPVQCWAEPVHVTFCNEAGICAGPRRELWSGFCKALASGEGHIFTQCDDGQLGLQPYAVFHDNSVVSVTPNVAHHNHLLHTVGMVFATVVFHGDTLSLNLAKPLIKQLLGLSLVHPNDLQFVDKELHHGLTEWLQSTDIHLQELELNFSCTLLSPLDNSIVDIPMVEGGRSLQVCQGNKLEYVKNLSHFKIEGSVHKELHSFLSGFWEVIPKEVLRVFNPDEFSLILSGVPTIDVEDWCAHTEYQGLASTTALVHWFWRLVRSLKEEEKALLLKFSTGSPRVPAGGFANLQGLMGAVRFRILLVPGIDKVPMASTCFNTLKLTEYSCEQSLRDKVLIAIRYGCEGFEFT